MHKRLHVSVLNRLFGNCLHKAASVRTTADLPLHARNDAGRFKGMRRVRSERRRADSQLLAAIGNLLRVKRAADFVHDIDIDG